MLSLCRGICWSAFGFGSRRVFLGVLGFVSVGGLWVQGPVAGGGPGGFGEGYREGGRRGCIHRTQRIKRFGSFQPDSILFSFLYEKCSYIVSEAHSELTHHLIRGWPLSPTPELLTKTS